MPLIIALVCLLLILLVTACSTSAPAAVHASSSGLRLDHNRPWQTHSADECLTYQIQVHWLLAQDEPKWAALVRENGQHYDCP